MYAYIDLIMYIKTSFGNYEPILTLPLEIQVEEMIHLVSLTLLGLQ